MALTPQAGVTGAPQDLTYNASPVLSRQVLDDYLARLGRANPQLARVATDQFARHDYRQIYRGLTRGTGLSENSLTDIMAAYTMLGWMIANNSLANPNPSYLKALRDQLAPVFASNARLAAPQTRGPLAEEMKIHFVTLHAGWQSAQREGRLQQYSDGVASLFRQQGTDLRALTLTPQGFARR